MNAIAELEGLKDACHRSGGTLVLPGTKTEEFLAILQEGGRHAIQNSPQEDGKFKNQAVLNDGVGAVYVFEIYTDEAIVAE